MTVGSSTDVQSTQAVQTETTILSDTYDSVQYNFAKLQLKMAQDCEAKATELEKEIEELQKQQQLQSDLKNQIAEAEEMVKLAEQCKADGEAGKGYGKETYTGQTLGNYTDKDGKKTLYPIPAELVEYCEANGIDYLNKDGDYVNGSEEWGQIVDNLKAYEADLQAQLDAIPETIDDDIQIKMLYLQDYISQYNSYLQGSNSAIAEAFDILQQMAKSIQ